MTKTDIIEGVFEQLGGFSKKEATAFVENTLSIVKETLKRGEYVKISGFGTFSVRSKMKRRGRNPKTGETVEITARKVCTYRPSAIVKELVNS